MAMINHQIILRSKRELILKTAQRYGAKRVRVFGSVVHGLADEHSDIDFLVDMPPGSSLMDLGGLLYDLRQLLGVEVDVVTEKSLRPRMRARVITEAVDL